MKPDPKIYVTGHRGMVGSAIIHQLTLPSPSTGEGPGVGVLPQIITRTHAELDLTNQADVRAFFEAEKPDQVYLAAACVHVMNLDPATYRAHTQPMLSHINVGTGEDITIRQLAETMGKVIGYDGKIEFDPTKPDGTPRKLLDVSRLQTLGWRPTVNLEEGLARAYAEFLER